MLIRVGTVDIWVSVQDIRGGTVRLGFTAPESVTINREEVVRRYQQSEKVPVEPPFEDRRR